MHNWVSNNIDVSILANNLWDDLVNELNRTHVDYMKLVKDSFLVSCAFFFFGVLNPVVFVCMYFFKHTAWENILGIAVFSLLTIAVYLNSKYRIHLLRNKIQNLNYKIKRLGLDVYCNEVSYKLDIKHPKDDLSNHRLIPTIRTQSKNYGKVDFKKYDEFEPPYASL